jgi:hypothetical protein
MFKEIKDYERESFLKDTDFTRLVQAMATYNFHCNLLKSMVPVVAETYELQPRFFQLIQDELQKIDQAIEITNDETKKILDSALSVEEKENLERQLTETGNRLYYTIQGMLQSVVEVFQPIVTELSDFKPAFDEIKQQYDQIAKPTHAGTAKTSTYVRRSKRPEEFSRANVILEAQLPTSKNRGFLYFMIFYIFSYWRCVCLCSI